MNKSVHADSRFGQRRTSNSYYYAEERSETGIAAVHGATYM